MLKNITQKITLFDQCILTVFFLTIAVDAIDIREVYSVTRSMNLELNQNSTVIIVLKNLP